MFLRIADDGDANAKAVGDGAFWNGFRGVIGALGVNVGAQFLEQLFDVGFFEEDDEINVTQGSDEFGAGVFVQNGATGTFQAENAGIGIYTDDEDVTFLPGAGEIAHMADVECIEAAVGKDDALAVALGSIEEKLESLARFNFGFGFTHEIRVGQIVWRRMRALQNCVASRGRSFDGGLANGFEKLFTGDRGCATLHDDQAASNVGDMRRF